tara:strand:- start:403 stop:579 length:177 start_codon:yes stop_codon:yes gene_type:complete
MTLFKEKPEDILSKGLQQMTIACDTLTQQNKILNKDVLNLKNKLRLAEEKMIINNINN